MDGAKLGILHDGSRLFVRLRNILARRDLGCWDAFGLVEIEDIRPADERNAGWSAVLAHHHVPGFVPLFEDLIVDDGSGFLALLHVPAKVERLLETDPERGLIVRGTKKQGIDSAVGFARDDVLDGEPGLLPGHGPALQLLDEPLGDRLIDVAVHSATSFRAISIADFCFVQLKVEFSRDNPSERVAFMGSAEKWCVTWRVSLVHEMPEIGVQNLGIWIVLHGLREMDFFDLGDCKR